MRKPHFSEDKRTIKLNIFPPPLYMSPCILRDGKLEVASTFKSSYYSFDHWLSPCFIIFVGYICCHGHYQLHEINMRLRTPCFSNPFLLQKFTSESIWKIEFGSAFYPQTKNGFSKFELLCVRGSQSIESRSKDANLNSINFLILSLCNHSLTVMESKEGERAG